MQATLTLGASLMPLLHLTYLSLQRRTLKIGSDLKLLLPPSLLCLDVRRTL
jgi:hypothetical protein